MYHYYHYNCYSSCSYRQQRSRIHNVHIFLFLLIIILLQFFHINVIIFVHGQYRGADTYREGYASGSILNLCLSPEDGRQRCNKDLVCEEPKEDDPMVSNRICLILYLCICYTFGPSWHPGGHF